MSEGRDKPQPSLLKVFSSRRLQGLEGGSIGFIWLGYILAGAFFGGLLDRHFRTDYWLPILVLGGALAGFRDVLSFTRRMSRQQNKTAPKRVDAAKPVSAELIEEEDASPEEVATTGRKFVVPPPPLPEYERKRGRGTDRKS